MLMVVWALGLVLSGCLTSSGEYQELVDFAEDQDGDGFRRRDAGGSDCDDLRGDISPAERESCDGLDNDCDGDVDEPGAEGEGTWYRDADGDGYGDPDGAYTGCYWPEGYVEHADDCDDRNPRANPGEVEVCGNGVDEDCDGVARSC